MNFVPQQEHRRPARGEAPFELNEVFYSRTDDRGVIQSGNQVFRRVADYQWSDLVGAPHKLVRHPDMPSGVFWLFWDQLKQGRAIGAYVKNKARDGLHYWVFAVALPFAGGYLSARIKPTSDVFHMVEGLYAKLRAAERAGDLTPEQSAMRLLEELKKHGYESYDDFAANALSAELSERARGLGQPTDSALSQLIELLEDAKSMTSETAALVKDFEGMQTIPYNMRVMASRLEPTGGPISALSQNYGAMSTKMSEWFEENVVGSTSNFMTIGQTVQTSLFLTGMVCILRECEAQMQLEHDAQERLDDVDETAQLHEIISKYMDLAEAGVAQVHDETARILSACKIMDRQVLGLSSTRVMCIIESSRLNEGAESLNDIILQLKVFQEQVSRRLATIEQHALKVSSAHHGLAKR